MAAANDSGPASPRSAAVSSVRGGGHGGGEAEAGAPVGASRDGGGVHDVQEPTQVPGPGLGGDARGCGGRMEGAHGPPVALRPSTHAPRASPGSSSSRTSRLSACGAARSSGSSGEEHDATWSSVRTNAWRGAGRTEGQTGVAVRVQGGGGTTRKRDAVPPEGEKMAGSATGRAPFGHGPEAPSPRVAPARDSLHTPVTPERPHSSLARPGLLRPSEPTED